MLTNAFSQDCNSDLVITGDFCPISSSSVSALKIGEGLRALFAQAAHRSVNLECPLTSCQQPIRKSGPAIKASSAAVELLLRLQVDLCNLANNHIMDFGANGLNETIDLLKNSNIGWAGINLGEPIEPCIVHLKGKSVAFVNFTENEFSTLKRSNRNAIELDYYLQFKQIKKAQQLADYVIVQYHGGAENYSYPTPGQKKYAHYLAELGASIVICHHSHCVSGYEVYEGVPIFYGLGNFYFPLQNRSPGWYTGLVVCITLGDPIRAGAMPVFFNQDRNCLDLIGTDDLLQQKIKDISKVIESDDLLLKEWEDFCARDRFLVISMLRHASKIKQLMIRKGIIKQAKMIRPADLSLFNRIRCETHREKLLTIMKNHVLSSNSR